MEFSRQEYWAGCHFLLQGLFLAQGSKLHLLHFRWMFCHWTTWNSYVAANDNSGQNHRKNKRTTQHCILILLSRAVFDKPTISCSSSCKGISLFLVKQNKNVPSNEWCKVGKTFLCSKSSKDFRILKLCCCCLYNCRIFVYDYWTFPSLCQSKIKQFFARRPTEITHKCRVIGLPDILCNFISIRAE